MVDLSVIVVSYNTKDLLTTCLRSIGESKDVSYEVIVIDNASTDGSVEMVRKEFPRVECIQNSKNEGFAKAVNQGLARASGKYLLLLNSDATVFPDTLASLRNYMDVHPQVGVVGCRILSEAGNVQFSTGYYPTLWRVAQWMLFWDDVGLKYLTSQYHMENRRFYETEHNVDWVQGACLLISRTAYEKIGGLDESIFMYGEDVEYGYRAKQYGFSVRYIPYPSIVHLGQGSSGSTMSALIGEYRGLMNIYRKYHGRRACYVLSFLLQLGAVLRFLLFGVITGRKEARQAYAACIAVAR